MRCAVITAQAAKLIPQRPPVPDSFPAGRTPSTCGPLGTHNSEEVHLLFRPLLALSLRSHVWAGALGQE